MPSDTYKCRFPSRLFRTHIRSRNLTQNQTSRIFDSVNAQPNSLFRLLQAKTECPKSEGPGCHIKTILNIAGYESHATGNDLPSSYLLLPLSFFSIITCQHLTSHSKQELSVGLDLSFSIVIFRALNRHLISKTKSTTYLYPKIPSYYRLR